MASGLPALSVVLIAPLIDTPVLPAFELTIRCNSAFKKGWAAAQFMVVLPGPEI